MIKKYPFKSVHFGEHDFAASRGNTIGSASAALCKSLYCTRLTAVAESVHGHARPRAQELVGALVHGETCCAPRGPCLSTWTELMAGSPATAQPPLPGAANFSVAPPKSQGTSLS